MKTFPLTIASPDGNLFDQPVVRLILRGTEGDLAVMAGHIPFITAVRPGDCRVELEDQPDRWYVVTPAAGITDQEKFAHVMARHLEYCDAHGVDSPYALGALMPTAAARRGDWEGYTYCYTQVDKPIRGVRMLTAPAGRYLTYFHAGSFDTVREGYRRLLDWADAHGLTLGELFWEDVLLDELAGKGYDQYLLRLSAHLAG